MAERVLKLECGESDLDQSFFPEPGWLRAITPATKTAKRRPVL